MHFVLYDYFANLADILLTKTIILLVPNKIDKAVQYNDSLMQHDMMLQYHEYLSSYFHKVYPAKQDPVHLSIKITHPQWFTWCIHP